MRPRVSVLVPSYNHADFIVGTISSALEALDVAGVEGEVRVLDDGSKDATLEKLGGLDDPRLCVSGQKNAGAHVAFNRLLSEARGELIFLLNSDDLYTPERIQRILQVFDAEPAAVAAGSWVEVIDTDDKRLGLKEAWRTLPPWPKPRSGPCLSELGDASLALLETNYLATTSNIAFRRAAIEPRFLDLRYCHDWEFFLSLIARGPFALVEEPLVRYRVHPTNTLRETEAEGTARMRFEIQWLLARHAGSILDAATRRGFERENLRLRLWNSLPHFGAETLLLQLFALRGDGAEVPPRFDDLLDLEAPFRRRAEELLRRSQA